MNNEPIKNMANQPIACVISNMADQPYWRPGIGNPYRKTQNS